MKLYEKIYVDLKEEIESGAFSKGALLPTEQALQKKYGVSRITVKHAYQLLGEQGYIRRVPGKGTLVTSAVRSQNKKIIGIVLCNFDSAFGEQLIKSMETAAAGKGYRVLLARSFGDHTRESEILADFIALGVSGIIIQNCHGDFTKNLVELFIRGFPVVSVDRYAKGLLIPSVTSDNLQGSVNATEYLFSKGHTSILYVSANPNFISTLTERLNGFQEAFMRHALPLSAPLLLTDITSPFTLDPAQAQRDIARIAASIQGTNCTAVIASERFVAELCLRAIDSPDRRLSPAPELVCFDYPDRLCKEVEFTYIEQNEAELGRRAVLNLCTVIDGGKPELRSVIPSKIVYKRSRARG